MRKWILLLVMVCAACGDGGSGGAGGDPALPRRDDPAFGSVGNALISDGLNNIDGVRDTVWIGFNRQQEWDDFVALNQRTSPLDIFWIGGHLIADPPHHLGFYFDPNTTESAEETVETIQTSIDGIKLAPQAFADQGWVIPAFVEKIVPTKK